MSKRSEIQVDQKDAIVLTPKNVQVFNMTFLIQFLIHPHMHIFKEKNSLADIPFNMICFFLSAI